MSFGNNVLFYRKKFGITQEELAEKLDVTRQTVSRWETDGAFPDMEKLLQLCDIFRCDMDVLVRGDAEKTSSCADKANLEAYDKHMNGYCAQITTGVTLILAGVTAMLFLSAIGGIKELVGVVVLLACITVAVAIFIASGCVHDNFMRENPRMEKYPEKRVKAFRARQPWLFSGATALILLGVIVVVTMTYEDGYAPAGFTVERWEYFSAGILLLAITVAVSVYVYVGMQYAKFDVKNYNKECRKEGYASELNPYTGGSDDAKGGADGVLGEKEKNPAYSPVAEKTEAGQRAERGEKLNGAICGALMLIATAVYLPLGFLGGHWHPGWIVFVVAGLLCGVSSVVIKAIFGEK